MKTSKIISAQQYKALLNSWLKYHEGHEQIVYSMNAAGQRYSCGACRSVIGYDAENKILLEGSFKNIHSIETFSSDILPSRATTSSITVTASNLPAK